MGSLLQKLPSSELMATVELLGHHGITREHFTRLRADSEFLNRITEFIRLESKNCFIHHKSTRVLMRGNFFGIEEWTVFYRANFSQEQLRQVAEFPWGEDVLASTCPLCGSTVNNCHFAFLGLDRLNDQPLTIFKFQELYPASGQPRFYSYIYTRDNWYTKEKFANEPTCEFRWYLMPLEIVPNSTNKTYPNQVAILPAEYEVPFAIEEISKDILFYKKNSVYLNPLRWGGCRDVASDDSRVGVGNFGSEGLIVGNLSDGCCPSSGLAASRKLPSAA